MYVRTVCALAAVTVLSGAAQASPESVIYRFASFPYGAGPHSSLTRDAQGNLYGTASQGGAANLGVVFKLDTTGNSHVLHSFMGGADGSKPFAPVTIGPAGNLFGTTPAGGANNKGVIYKLDSSGNETTLYAFTGQADGGEPQSGVIADSAGNLYGTASLGGTGNNGVVYKLNPSGQETVLYSFAGGRNGRRPIAGVIQDAAGNLYGTTVSGGTSTPHHSEGCGVVYKISPSGHETVLYTFACQSDGADPVGGVIADSSGNLYGTTKDGGVPGCGCGVIYKVDSSGHQTVLYSFIGGAEGGKPVSGLTRDAGGNLYGTSEWTAGTSVGALYKLDAAGNLTVLSTLQVFQGNVSTPYANPVPTLDPSGNLYGTAPYNSPGGTIYKVDPLGQLTTPFSFPPASGGTWPWAGLARDAAGNLFGTTTGGGASNVGVVFKINTSGSETVLHSFGLTDGADPLAGVVLDPVGNLYGTTSAGGAEGCGVVFRLDLSGNETVLHSFAGGADGCNPYAGVTRDASGNLYGTTKFGGTTNACDCGMVYKVDPSGNETVLYSFTGGTDGAWPEGGVVVDTSGNLYGVAAGGGTENGGVVFRLDPSGNEIVLYRFSAFGNGGGGPTGAYPAGNLALDSNGNIYGTAWAGGSTPNGCQGYGCGTVFEIDASGQFTMLYSFSGGGDGGMPNGGIIRDAAGNLYGTTQYGGRPEAACPLGLSEGCGVVFKIDPSGNEKVLYRFTGGADGAFPYAGVTIDPAGYLYGTSSQGGLPGAGVVFQLALN